MPWVLHETLAGVLETDLAQAGDDRLLVELGLDSISCVVWLCDLNRALGLTVTMAQVGGHPTFGELRALIEGRMGEPMNTTRQDPTARSAVVAYLRQSLARELEVPEGDIEDDVPFVELGLDSITGVIWTRQLNTRFRLSLSATQVYSHPTVDELADHLLTSLETDGTDAVDVAVVEQTPSPGPGELVYWLRTSLAAELELPESELDDETPFVELGLDSITGVTWTRAMNTHLGLSLSATTVYRHPTITELARYLAEEQVPAVTEEPASPPEPVAPAAGPGARKQAVELVDIAVVGMSGAFPHAGNVNEFWRIIVEGRDCVSEVPPSRWPVSAFYDERQGKPGKSYSRWMGVLENAHEFDPLFFGISPNEAEHMDPQQRVLLRESWRCFEEAGYSPEAFSSTRCGVFVGCSVNGYGGWHDETELSAYQNLGTNTAILASRVSYALNLKGPCLSIDTSCSSSLVAIASACDSLCLGDSDAALAGGVWVIPGPGVHVAMSQLGALSPDGRCFAFDERANGFVPAEGVGVVLLKRLSDAQAAGDRIHAIIKGWGVNQDGRSNGITAPNAEAQVELQRRVYEKFDLDPTDIHLVEAHGTGTALGDPVEIDGLTRSFAEHTDRRGYCALGSVKSNIGHTACAAGIASTIKAVLALEHETLPPTIHYERLNPHIDLSGTPFFVNTEARAWPAQGAPRLAAVSSFGYSGTNAHLVLAGAPQVTAPRDTGGERLITLSARTAGQLDEQARQLLAHLERQPAESLRALSYTLALGRKHFRHRLALVAGSTAEVVRALRGWLETGSAPAVRTGDSKPKRPEAGVEQAFAGGGRREMEMLAERYTRGEALPHTLFDDGAPARISLPTYPFARDSYWLTPPTGPRADRADDSRGDVLCFEPRWEQSPQALDKAAWSGEHTVWLVGHVDDEFQNAVRALLPSSVDVRTFATGTHLAPDYLRLTTALLADVRALAGRRSLLQVVLIGDGVTRIFAGVAGLLKTACLEDSLLRAQCVEYLDAPAARAVADLVLAEARDHKEPDVRHLDGRRYVRRLAERPVPSAASPWREGGVHLVTGGLGGLGLLVAQEIARNLRGGTIVLAGRSALDADSRTRLSTVDRPGVAVAYRQVDVADREAVDRLIADLAGQYGPLYAIVHCAGVLHDGPIATKSDDEVRAVLAPKVSGVVNLDEASRDQPLDQFIVFSSTVAAFGNAGQADYAAANGFLDAYAAHRDHLAARGERSGRALAIAWPLWADGGMRLDEAGRNRLRPLGVTPLAADDGLRIFSVLAADGTQRAAVLAGDRDRLLTRLSAYISMDEDAEPTSDAGRETWQRTVVEQVAVQLRVPAGEIDLDSEFGDLGFDPMGLTELADRLNRDHGLTLLPTVFFEYPTLGSLAAHLVEQAPAAAEPDLSDGLLRDGLVDELAAEVCAQLGVPAEEIDPDGELGDYGFDSISLTELANRVNDRYGLSLTPTMFFEHRTLASVAAHLLDTYGDDLACAHTLPTPQATGGETEPLVDERVRPQIIEPDPAAPIAIIGMSGSFPQAPDLAAFWDILRTGRDCITEIPPDRWDWQAMQDEPARAGNRHVRWGGFLDGVDRFDPLFFGISPREAVAMDPQQRLLLTHVWQALEDAGYAPSSLAGSDTAVLIGTAPSGYGNLVLREQDGEDGYSATGVSGSVGPNRVSYLLDLHGPSEPVETACSSSLVAVHRGVELLRRGVSGLALVGGVNTIVSPDLHISYSRAGMLSEDGRCKTFSARADGYSRGEGVGILVLKPLAQAERDGDRVHGVIRGSAENHGGRAHSLTAPNPIAQTELLMSAYRQAGIDPRTVTYIETHGTGTELGDPVEITALKNAFAAFGADTPGARVHCGLGAVKSNIGHLELAAGVAGVIKTLLQMRHETLVESLHCADLNPYLRLEDSPFHIVRERGPWIRLRDADGHAVPLRAGVSSFGFGGVNAHVVLEEYRHERTVRTSSGASPALIVLSARTAPQLTEQARRLLEHLRDNDVDLVDLAFTLQRGRDEMEERLATWVTSVAALRRALAVVADGGNTPENWFRGRAPRRALGTAEQRAEAGRWLDAGEYDTVLAQWVQGHPVDWRRLYVGADRPVRVGLPTYPFAEESYWVGREVRRTPTTRLHPMVHRDVSGDGKTAYETVFDGSEPFLRDHVVRGSRVLPGAAQLEMAHAAVAAASGEQRTDRVRLGDIVWLRPAVCGADGLRLRVTVRPAATGEYEYAIHSVDLHSIDANGSDTLCGQGRASLSATPEPRVLSLDEVRAGCAAVSFPGADVYELYARVGMDYGLAQRSLTGLAVGTDGEGRPQVLAELTMPPEAEAVGRYRLHPSIVDGALQATIGLGMLDTGGERQTKPALPFALQGVDLAAETPAKAYVWIRHQEGGASTKLDLTLCGEDGRVCVELTGLSSRVLHAEPAPVPRPVPDALGYFQLQLAIALQLDAEQVDVDTPLENYGMNSMMAMTLTRHLEKSFGQLPKTLFFEVQTIRALSEHFAAEYPEQLAAVLPRPERAPEPSVVVNQTVHSEQTTEIVRSGQQGADIAIIGVSGRYPGAEDLDEFWANLRAARDCVTEIPADRWDHRRHPDHGKWGGFLDGVDRFDPLFFHISPREAEYLDPQERLFLQCVHHTLEDAGYTGALLARTSAEPGDAAAVITPSGRVGVFVGVMYEEYQLHGAQAQARGYQVALSGSPSSIANRVSYFFDFHGPSMAVDTMCSSSLTAIHLACEAIKSGQCATAVAGGVNLTLHPNKYLMLAQGKFAASDGRCRSFGEGGDGYVPGEGVGAVLLKPLDRAIADGDRIHGVIKGSALNHGGRTHGFSVPSPVAQGDVIARALAGAGVDPRELSYLEAHGTGTSLGDPIELAGLVKAFRRTAGGPAPRDCAIGSVKSNIGHCESAAGIAGVTKVLLQLRHGELVPSLHSSTLNPHLDFDGTPFRVQQRLEPWPTDGGARPRVAGVSSFGAGGSNAHVVIAEYQPETSARPKSSDDRSAVVLLSAKSGDQLVEQARRLLARVGTLTDEDLPNIAWTLQIGRVAMEERLAFTATSLASFERTLASFVADPGTPGEWFRGSVRADGTAFTDDERRAAVDAWRACGESRELLRLWVQGMAVEWEPPRGGGRRVSLPGYPFARERYWLDSADVPIAPEGTYPLLHRNESTAFELAFSASFDGSEPFLRDHLVDGRPVLPAVAQLEMVREAVTRVLDVADADRVRLHDVVWLRPAALSGSALRVRLRLSALSDSEIEYELFTDHGDLLCAKGKGGLVDSGTEPEPLSLERLRAACSRAEVTGDEVYARFAGTGLDYGPAYRGLERLSLGVDEVLAAVRQPAGAGAGRFHLHPSVLDAALQAVAGLAWHSDAGGPAVQPMLPFALDSLRAHAATPEHAQVWGRPARDGHAFDLDVCDEDGRVCVELRGLTLHESRLPAAERDNLLLLRPIWEDQHGHDATPAFAERHVVVIGGLDSGERDTIAGALPEQIGLEVVDLGPDSLDQQYLKATWRVFAVVRGILESRPRGPVLLQVVLAGRDDRDVCFDGVNGLLRTASLENPRLRTQYIACLDAPSPDAIVRRLHEEARRADEPEVRYHGGRRSVRRFAEVAGARPATTPWRSGGVYLITGGAGGLGLILANAIAAESEGATVVLTGRSPLDEKQAALDALRATGLRVDYRRADITDRQAVADLLAHIADAHGPLTGILHGAGVLHDDFIIRKTQAELASVLAPKTAGLVHLDELTGEQPLELFVCLSSMSAALGNPGQADYAAANGFLDAYTAYRAGLVAAGLRRGTTLSVDWPLWAEGGMGLDEATRENLAQLDLVPLGTEDGLHALRCGLAAEENGLRDGRLLVLAGRRSALLPRMTGRTNTTKDTEARMPVVEDRAVEDRALRYFRREVADGLKLDPARLDADTALERYGMDSVVGVELIARFEKSFGPLSKTLFFEVPTVRALVEHFTVHHGVALRSLFGEPAAPARPAPAVRADRAPRRMSARRAEPPAALPESDGIAVIGISGRYPGAADLDELWANLRSGKDCVGEVPADRWDHAALFDPDRDAPGRSYCAWGGFLDGVDCFDPLFFGISPREAETMDPQQRLFLETAWQLMEQSGITQGTLEQRYERRVGVYVGAMYQMYRADEADVARRALTSAASYNLIANRVSHFFGLEGPSLAVDSMCSSSSMAVHLACADLLRGESTLAIAGGVNLTVHPDKYIALSQAQMLGSHPGSRTFRDGDGYLPAEGVGAVLLKPLAAASRDGDTILAVIRGSASLHGGRANRFMTPSHKTQVNVLRRALKRAGAEPTTIGYVEAAANGSALGDAVEFSALREVFGGVPEPVALGSVKSNLGHPEAASGVAQLTKVILQLRHGQLAPLVDVGTVNPNLDLDDAPVRLCDDLAEWPRLTVDGRPVPRRALVNSVGAGGSYVGIVVEAPPEPEATDQPDEAAGPQLIVLSAGNAERLRAAAQRLLEFVERDDSVSLADLAYTLQVGREPLPERLAVVACFPKDLRRALERHLQPGRGDDPTGDVSLWLGNADKDAGPLGSVLSGPHGAGFVAALVDDGDLDRLGALWVAGGMIPWAGLHRGPRRLLPVPTTVFQRTRYWVGRTWRPQPEAALDTPALPVDTRTTLAARDGDFGGYLMAFFADALGLDAGELSLDSEPHSVGADSILWLRLQRAVQNEFGLTLSAREIAECRTLGAVAVCLTAKHGAAEEPVPVDEPEDTVRAARTRALEAFRQGKVSADQLKALMKEAQDA